MTTAFDHKKDALEVAHVEYSRQDSDDNVMPHSPGEKVADLEGTNAVADIDEGYDADFVKRTMRKVDWRLLPILIAMYCVSLIDRTNLSIARQGNNMKMNLPYEKGGLGLALGDRYSIITLIFFPPYILLEIPSQLGLRKFGAKLWLSSAVVLWGIIMIGMGWVKTWGALAALRAVLGIFEAALFPGAAFLISCWYPRRQMATRNGIFYVSSSVIGTLSSLIGYCFTLMDGLGGGAGWQWVFTMYGIITVIVGIVAYFTIVDFPDKAAFLTEEEKSFVLTRIERDRGDSVPDPVTMAKVFKYICDLKIWLFGLFFMSATVAAYSLAYFSPVILATMGFTNFQSMVLGTPSAVWSLIPTLLSVYIADKYKHMRALMIVINATMLIIGTLMYSQLPKSQKAARFAGVFFASGGSTANVPLIVSWAQTSIRHQSKRAVSAGIVIAWGGIGGIMAGVVFRQQEYLKSYPTGVFFTVGMNAFTIVFSLLLALYFRRQNRRADRGEIVLEDSPEFRYQY